MRKKFFKQFAMYYNLILIGLISFIWLSTKTIELFELCFVVISIIFIIRTYVFKVVLVPVRVVPSRGRRNTPRRSYTSPQQTTTINSPSRTNNTTAVNQQRPIQPSRILTPRPTVPARTPTSHNIAVVEGIEVTPSVKTDNKSKITKEQLRQMIPIAQNLTQDDFRCIFCYELPVKSSDQVVICPNCKKPAHYPEYQKWTAYSNYCSYCNQDIGNRTPKRVSGKNYKSIIGYALKN